MYGGGGYTIDLGPKQSLVEQYIENLKNLSWIDGKTRAVFFETNTFNANTRLFSHLKIVFEISEYGSIYMTTRVKSLNLYPYVTSMDYIILGCQLIFVFIIIVRIVLFAVYIFKKRSACFRTFSSWIIALDLFLSLIAVIFYILRIDTTIKAINDIIESRGTSISYNCIYNEFIDVTASHIIMVLECIFLSRFLCFSRARGVVRYGLQDCVRTGLLFWNSQTPPTFNNKLPFLYSSKVACKSKI